MTRKPGVALKGNETMDELRSSLAFLQCERNHAERSGNDLRRCALMDAISEVCDAMIEHQLRAGWDV